MVLEIMDLHDVHQYSVRRGPGEWVCSKRCVELIPEKIGPGMNPLDP